MNGVRFESSVRRPRFRTSVRAAALLVLACTVTALTGCSDDAAPTAQNSGPPGNGTCIQTGLVGRAQIMDDSTILFIMKDGTAWKNTLRFSCSGLTFENGFEYTPDTTVRACSNDQTIRVEHTGTFCELGQFTASAAPLAAGK